MLEKLKNFGRPNGERCIASSVEEMIELSACASSLRSEYVRHGIPDPKWLQEVTNLLARQIQVRHHAEMEEKLRKAERELEELRSQEEKRAAKEKEVEELRKALAVKP